MRNRHHISDARLKAGMTVVEVLIATILLILGLSSFLAAFASIQRTSVTADNRIAAMQHAREILEAIMAQPYDSAALNIGQHSLPNSAHYTVTLASDAVTTKNIDVTVPWYTSQGNKQLKLTIHDSMAKCIHE